MLIRAFPGDDPTISWTRRPPDRCGRSRRSAGGSATIPVTMVAHGRPRFRLNFRLSYRLVNGR